MRPIGRWRLRHPWRYRAARKRYAADKAEFRESERITGLCTRMDLPIDDPAARRYAEAGLHTWVMDRRMTQSIKLSVAVVVANLIGFAIHHGTWLVIFPIIVLGIILPMQTANLENWRAARAEFLEHWTGPWPPVDHG